VNNLVVTNSTEANIQLTRIHEHIFARDPTVAAVWRRQTFSAAVEECSPQLSKIVLDEHIPYLTRLLSTDGGRTPNPAMVSILESAYSFSRMLHASRSSSGGITDAFYRAYVPDLGSVLYPRQIELVKRCLRSECGEVDRVGSCIFFGLVKMTRTPENAAPAGEVLELTQTVVRRAQVICECALGMVGAATAANGMAATPRSSYTGTPPPGERGYGRPQTHGYAEPPAPGSESRVHDIAPADHLPDHSVAGRPALHLNI